MSPQASGWCFRKPIARGRISFPRPAAGWKRRSSKRRKELRKGRSCSFPGSPPIRKSWPFWRLHSPSRTCACSFRTCQATAIAPAPSLPRTRKTAQKLFSPASWRAAWRILTAPSSQVIPWAEPSPCASAQKFPLRVSSPSHQRLCEPPTACSPRCCSTRTPAPCRSASWSSTVRSSPNPCAPMPPTSPPHATKERRSSL